MRAPCCSQSQLSSFALNSSVLVQLRLKLNAADQKPWKEMLGMCYLDHTQETLQNPRRHTIRQKLCSCTCTPAYIKQSTAAADCRGYVSQEIGFYAVSACIVILGSMHIEDRSGPRILALKNAFVLRRGLLCV